MKWPLKPLSEVADFCLGKMLDQKKNTGELMPYLANLNVQWSGFVLDNLREMRFEAHELDRYGLKQGDIVMCEGGEPGRCSIWKEQKPGMMFQKALHRIRPRSCLDNRFLYFNLRKQAQNDELSGLFTGSTIKHLPREKLALVQVPVPSSMEDQRRVADVLSAYDDLIENNHRRIALLEESARLLYREWFVHFRFPGHEHVEIVDGLPEGWERRPFGKIADLEYGKSLKAENRIAGEFPVYGSSGIVGFHNANLAEGPAIIVGRKGNVGSVYYCPENFWPIDTVYYIPKHCVDYWLYLALPEAGFQNTHAGVPGLNREFAYSRELVVPPPEVRELFEDSTEHLFAQRAMLQYYNSKLAQARDLLLPRLMNEDITV